MKDKIVLFICLSISVVLFCFAERGDVKPIVLVIDEVLHNIVGEFDCGIVHDIGSDDSSAESVQEGITVNNVNLWAGPVLDILLAVTALAYPWLHKKYYFGDW